MVIKAWKSRGHVWGMVNWARAMSLEVETESSKERHEMVDGGYIVQGLSHLVKEFGLCFAGKKEPIKLPVRGVTYLLLCISKIPLAATHSRTD